MNKFVYLFSKIHEIRILKREQQLICVEYGLQTWLTSTEAKRVWTRDMQPISE